MNDSKLARRRQSGVALIVGLILLIVLTIMGVSAINVSTLNLRNVRNMQDRQLVLEASQQAVESVMSNKNNFVLLQDRNVTVKTPRGDFTVAVKAPYCTASSVRVGSLLGSGLGGGGVFTVRDTYWDIRSNATDTNSGASVEIHQGVMVPMSSDCG